MNLRDDNARQGMGWMSVREGRQVEGGAWRDGMLVKEGDWYMIYEEQGNSR